MDVFQQRTLVIRRLFIAQLVLLVFSTLFVIVFYFYTKQLGSFVFSFFAGCLGGSIAMVRRLPGASTETIEFFAVDWISTLMPLLYGGLMAVVAYLLFMSGILTGTDLTGTDRKGLFVSNLFPSFDLAPLEDDKPLNMRDILKLRPNGVINAGKLMVWCFLAGFSERFIIGILGRLENHASSASNKEKSKENDVP